MSSIILDDRKNEENLEDKDNFKKRDIFTTLPPATKDSIPVLPVCFCPSYQFFDTRLTQLRENFLMKSPLDSDTKTGFNPIPYGLFNKPKVMGGGQICPPLVIWLLEDIFNILF